jgi:hypothetical protein
MMCKLMPMEFFLLDTDQYFLYTGFLKNLFYKEEHMSVIEVYCN